MRESEKQLILVLNMSKSNKVTSTVEAKVEAGTCLGQLPDGSECNREVHRRGLCTRCYYRYRSLKGGMKKSDAAVFESELVRIGRLLDSGEAQQIKNKSVFVRIAKGAAS